MISPMRAVAYWPERSSKVKYTRIVSSAAVALAAALGLSACGGGVQPGATDAAGSGQATAWALTGGAEAAYRATFDAWNEEHADNQIAVEWFANDAFKEKIRTAVNTEQSPTLVQSWGGATVKDYATSGVITDLTDSTAELQERIFDSVLASGEVDGKLYAVPNNQTQPVLFFYNKDLFAEKGLEAPKTWEDFMKVVDAFAGTDVTPVALAGQSQWPYLMWIQYLTDRIGGPEVFQRVLDGEQDAWSDPAITQALETIQELVDKGAFGSSYGSIVADNMADTALVHTGKAAMVLQGAWVFSNFLTSDEEFVSAGKLGFAGFPTVEDGAGDPSNLVGNTSNFWALSSKSSASAQQTATDFLNEMNLSDEHVDELLAIGAVPPVKGIEDKIGASENSEYMSYVYESVKAAEHFQLSWDQALPSAQAQALLTNLSEIFLGQITPEQFVTNMNATL